MKHFQTHVKAGSAVFAALFIAFSLFLLLNLGTETKFSASGKLFAQPRFWPAVGVIGMTAFGCMYLLTLWRQKSVGSPTTEVLHWLRAVEFLIWFMVYVWLVPIIGYLLATVLFTISLALRQGYQTRREIITAAGVGLIIVVVFKTALAVKIPGGALYEFLPPALRNFMIINF